MPSVTAAQETHLQKFQGLLRELFQFDCADLDFGIYRVMNHKRDVVEKFICEKLPAAGRAQLDTGPLADQTRAADELAEAARLVRENISENAIDADSVLAEQPRNPTGAEMMFQGLGNWRSKVAGNLDWVPLSFAEPNAVDIAACDLDFEVQADYGLHDIGHGDRKINTGTKAPEEGMRVTMVARCPANGRAPSPALG